ncbi:hypothetical protein B0A50_07529 [Salinomyces thailandicus]|uniref:Uncharacterized protein n=1 Tax=Salinomyces thailandicus TaxID=706561 RepID=A0A4U0TMV8_9PEZI|nr:hypothetical protein B0A50_07529 [Salinomyces thailandica]
MRDGSFGLEPVTRLSAQSRETASSSPASTMPVSDGLQYTGTTQDSNVCRQSNKEYYQIPIYYEDQTLWFDYLIFNDLHGLHQTRCPIEHR